MSFRETFGEGAFRMASGYGRTCISDSRTVIDAIRRDRLAAAAAAADLDALDIAALKALVLQQHEQHLQALCWKMQQIEHLKLVIEKLRRMMFGTKSEKTARQIEQLELKLEELEAAQAAVDTSAELPVPEAELKSFRRPLPEDLPREVVTHLPEHHSCPDCGGALRQFGEDVAEQLERIPASFRVIRHVRPKLACANCERIVEAPAPARPIERGLAGPGLLAHVLVAKYADYVVHHIIAITARCTVSPISMLAKASLWTGLRWPVGSERPASY